MSSHNRPFSKGREVHSQSHSHGQVQNVKTARVFVFGDGDLNEDTFTEGSEFEMPEIRPRGRRGHSGSGGVVGQHVEDEELFLEKEIGEGETLQSLSLKYACPMSELKRINNLIKDQDFFALRVLKIPMRRHGYLSELLKQEGNEATTHKAHKQRRRETITSDSDIPSDAICTDVDFSDPETQYRVMRTVSIRDNFSQQGQEANRFLKKMDKDLAKLRQSTITERGSLDEVVSVLTNKTINVHPLQNKVLNGADCGISRWVIVSAAISVALVIPIIYFVYVKYFMNNDDEH